MTTKTWVRLPLTTVSIGSENWQNSTIRNIKSSQNLIKKSERNLNIGKLVDELPSLRDEIGKLSNDKCHLYSRQTRKVVLVLRENITKTNESIKHLIKSKENIHVALECIRKDILTNKNNFYLRSTRPKREKVRDGADDLFQLELSTLKKIKKIFEDILSTTKQHLQETADIRKRLSDVAQERCRVLDLVCQAMSFIQCKSSQRPQTTPEIFRYSNSTRLIMRGSDVNLDDLEIDSVGALTPDAANALQDSKIICKKNKNLMKEISDCIEKCSFEKRMVQTNVNKGLSQKIAETQTLSQQLEFTKAKTRSAINRNQRHIEITERAKGYLLGPVSSADITTREKLNRPLVRVYHRHPGNQLPEASILVSTNGKLDEALKTSDRNLASLHLAKLRMQQDIKDKKAASGIDSAIMRLRRRRSNYRWVMEGANHERRQPSFT